MKILLLEDEDEIVEYLQIILEERFACECLTFDNGADGLKAATDQAFDLIITDHMMPKLTGGGLAKKLRESNGPNQKTKIIMLSGYIDDELKKMLSSLSIDYVSKPISADDFLEFISSRLS